MKTKAWIVFAILFIVGMMGYVALLWQPFGGWLFEHVILPLELWPKGRNPNVLEGIVLSLLHFVILAIVFLLPYLLLWAVIIAVYFRLKQ